MLIDTHCHLNDPEAFPDPAGEVDEALRHGVGMLLVVGIDPPGWRRAIALAERFDAVKAIIGWHPNHAGEYTGLTELSDLLQHPQVVALGEIGLDYHWDFATPEVQRWAFLDQLALAREVNLPVVIHCRDAYDDLLSILEAEPPHPFLLHCFAGNARDAQRALALGAYFGVDGPITYKNAHGLREVVAGIPLDRLVVETDSPYMTPAPHRGKPNRPAFVRYVNEGLAQLFGVSAEECAAITTSNAKAFFGVRDKSRAQTTPYLGGDCDHRSEL